MANELQLQISLTYAAQVAGQGAIPQTVLSFPVTVTGTAITQAVQNVGTAEETLALGDVVPGGYALFKNLDSTNYIEIGKATGVYVLKLKPGEAALCRLDAWTSIFAKANVAAVNLQYLIFPD